MRKILYTVGAYALIWLLSTAAFIALFHTPLFVSVDILFYRGCLLLAAASVISVALAAAFGRSKRSPEGWGWKDAVVVWALFTGVTLGWFTLLPVTVERSVTVYMLSYMEQNRAAVTAEEFGSVFYDQYITEDDAFGKRFHEQEASGNMAREPGGGYVLTERGELFVKLFRLCAVLFHTDQRLVYPSRLPDG